MKIYVINLDKDGLKFAMEQAKKNSFAFERIAGVYAKEMTTPELKRDVNYLRYTLGAGKKAGLGEIGCALSYIKYTEK